MQETLQSILRHGEQTSAQVAPSCSAGRGRFFAAIFLPLVFALGAPMLSGCARTAASTRVIEVTGYCGCGKCNGYTRGSWKFLKLDVWHRELDYGAHKGEPYTGRTAGGGWLRTPQPGLFSVDSIKRPWMIPVRIVVIPWILPRDGTIAADTDYYAFGTRMYIDGWGWGVVDDRGGAIKGSNRLDLYHRTHGLANKWGRRNVEVKIVRKN